MKTEQINIRLEADVVSALQRVAQVESSDRSTVIKRLLEASLRQWGVDRAIEDYRRGEISLGRAAEEANLTQWELLDLLKRERVAYPLDLEELRERLAELGDGEDHADSETLPDFPPRPGCVLLVGINPTPVSVRAGHYYQGRIGQRIWRRLERIGLLTDPVPGREDEAFARAGHGLTDLVKRPTRSASDLHDAELAAGVEVLREKIRSWRPGLILFAFKAPASRLLDPSVSPGVGPTLDEIPTFLLTGPYAPAAETERVDAELGALVGSEEAPSGDHESTQRVTMKDLERGQIRLEQPARRFFPGDSGRVQIVVRGQRLTATYDPRVGPDRNRSPVLRIGSEPLRQLVKPNEQLRVSRGLGGVVQLD